MARKKKRRSSGLGYVPAGHQSLARSFAQQSVRDAREVTRLSRKGDCMKALRRMLDAAERRGAASEHYFSTRQISDRNYRKAGAKQAGSAAFRALQVFKKHCAVGQSRHNAAFGKR